MNNTVIKGVVVSAPASETSESYTRYEIPVKINGSKEPIIVEMYGMRDIAKRFLAGKTISIIVQKRTRPVMHPIFSGYIKKYDSFFTAAAVT